MNGDTDAPAERTEARRMLPLAGAILAGAYAVTLILIVRPIALDEFEFARATYWISQGQVPFRDFWEHHSPLQWQIFAWIPPLVSTEGLRLHLVLRFAQIPLWLITFFLGGALAVRAGASRGSAGLGLLLLGTSVGFVGPAIEYRVDTVSTALIVIGLALVSAKRWAPAAFGGAALALAPWANLRSVAIVAAVGVALLVHAARQRSRDAWSRAGATAIGGLAAGGAILGWLYATGSMEAAFGMLVRDNAVVDESLRGLSFPAALAALARALDVTGLLLLLGGAAGAALALFGRARTSADPSRFPLGAVVALAWVVELLFVATRGVVYPYHLQALFVLAVPLVAALFERPAPPTWPSVRRVAAIACALALLLNFVLLSATGAARARFALQQEITRLAAQRAGGGSILDGTAWVLDAKPAFRLWFLPAAARILTAQAGGLAVRDFKTRPTVVVADRRLAAFLLDWPGFGAWLAREYVPETRDVWVRGCGSRLEPEGAVACDLPVGRWRVFASPGLSGHPWFTAPLEVPLALGARARGLEVDLPALSGGSIAIAGRRVASGQRLQMRSPGRIVITNQGAAPAGVIVVPDGLTRILRAPHGGIFPEPPIFDVRGWQ